VKSKTG